MATKNIVPRSTNEGQLGRSGKRWAQGNFVTASATYISGSLIPHAANTYDLGSASLYWKDIFISSGSLKFVNPATSAVIQEIKATSTGVVFQSGSGLVANISGSTISGSALHIQGDGKITGDFTLGGDITIGDANTDSLSISADLTSNLVPNTDNAYDFGSTTKRWRNIYLSGSVSSSGGPHYFNSDSTVGITAVTTLTAKGNGGASFGDDVGTWEFDGAGALSETGMTTVSITPSSTLDIDAGGAVTIDGSAITIGGDSDVAIDMDASTFDVDASGAVTVDSSAGAITIGGNAVGQKISVGGDTANRTEVELNAILVDINAGTNGVTIDGAGASTLTTSAGDITIDSVAGSVNVDGGESATNAVRIVASHTDGGIDVDAGTNGINVDSTGAISIGATNATSVTLGRAGQTITMPGNVDVNGTVFTIDATNIMISESFATFCSGSNIERDGGFMVESSSLSSGKGFGWDASIGRWGVDHDLAYDATSIGAESAQGAYLALVLDGTTYSHTTGSEYTKPGNIWIDGDDDIWIYT